MPFPGHCVFRRSATYISKHGVSPFPTLQPIVFRIAQFPAGKKDISFKVAHFESCLEGKALRFVRHDKFTVFQGFPQVFDGKFVFLVNLVIVGRIGKDSRNDTMIDEVVLYGCGQSPS